ncbi:MAG TPA: SAM-dependent methyltransferase [Armatimonadetes bacterium]|nr:SAM-dependent methyltransferase [Armatimonadota bacterium]
MKLNSLSSEELPRRLTWAIGFLSGGVLAQEVLLTRLFSIIQWHHFAYLVISLALLGYGASGTFLTLTRRRLLPHFEPVYLAFSLAFAGTSVLAFALAQQVPFNPFEIIWDRRQQLYLLALYLLLFVPFFCGATCIGLALHKFAAQVPRLYFADLVGAGSGALLSVGVLFLIRPAQSLLAVACTGLASAWVLSRTARTRLAITLGGVAYLAFFGFLHPLTLNISPYKALPATLLLPQARILSERFSPLGLLHVVSSPAIRHAPGLSLNYFGSLPPQRALFTDADSLSALVHWEGDRTRLEYLDYLSSALPYHLRQPRRVLVLGAGGGTDVLQALYHRAERVEAVELNPQVVQLVRGEQGDFADHLYDQPEVQVYVAEARGFLETTREKYDLIQLALLDSFSASSAGVYALSESYLYTVEALRIFFRRLQPEGMLSITRWLKFPPRDGLKLLATAVAALEAQGVAEPAQHLVFIRSWKTSTLVVSRSPLGSEECAATRKFCDERSFDLIYLPGLRAEEANQYNWLEGAPYYQAAQAILFGDREAFFAHSPFYLEPATDDRPYFFHFFKWQSLPQLWKRLGREWVLFAEWGYVVLVAALVQVVVVSVVLILLPLLALQREPTEAGSKGRVFLYFLALGLAFLFIEMAFIQKFLLFLSHPLYAIAVVLCGFLVFAGAGSFCSTALERRARRVSPIAWAVTGILFTASVYLWGLDEIFRWTRGLPDTGRILLSLALIAPLAFFMGMPFPLGLRRVATEAPALIPWAWGINGCASVLSAVLATLLAIHFGFSRVVLLALGLYALAAGCWPRPSIFPLTEADPAKYNRTNSKREEGPWLLCSGERWQRWPGSLRRRWSDGPSR